MKKIVLMGLLALVTAVGYTQCPIDAKRHNGNPGECTAQLTLIFNQPPVDIDIDSIYVSGIRLAIPLNVLDIVHVDGVWKVRYCLTGGNYPNIGLFRIWFRSRVSDCFVCIGCNPVPIPNVQISHKRISKEEIYVQLVIGDHPLTRYVIELSYDGGKTWVYKDAIVPAGKSGTYYLIVKQ